MSEDQFTLLTLDLRLVPELLRSGAIFEHVQRSPPTFPTMPLRWRSLPINLRSLPFNSRLFPIDSDFQIGLDREQIVTQWNGSIRFFVLLWYSFVTSWNWMGFWHHCWRRQWLVYYTVWEWGLCPECPPRSTSYFGNYLIIWYSML